MMELINEISSYQSKSWLKIILHLATPRRRLILQKIKLVQKKKIKSSKTFPNGSPEVCPRIVQKDEMFGKPKWGWEYRLRIWGWHGYEGRR